MLTNLIRFVSGGGSAASESEGDLKSDPAPKSAAVVKNCRRFQWSFCRLLTLFSFRAGVIRDEHEPRTRIYAFNSFFSSLRNRQSVPCAMIFCGLDLIMPAS